MKKLKEMKKNSRIRILIMDVDGTLTDGKIYMSPSGEAVKAFDVKDGYGIANLLPRMGIEPVIITGRTSEILQRRCEELKIQHVYQGISDKLTELMRVMEEFGVSAGEAAYIGDDINDLECMKLCGITACPSDAAEEVKKTADIQCSMPGGGGAVREFIDHLRHSY